jgi:hypothetical protein
MPIITEILSNASVVNYTNILTSVPNEVYVIKTDTPDSLASLMKNNITIQLSLSPETQIKISKLEEKLQPKSL